MDTETLVRTRRSLHAVAELVLAGPQYRASGTIRLRACPGGFGTVAEPWLRVVGAELVGRGRAIPLVRTSCGALGAALGLDAGAPAGLYGDGPGIDARHPIEVDPEAARRLAHCFALGDAALVGLFPGERPVIWPEHFDLGVSLSAVNYGVSPGDAFLAEPYAYVGPHADGPRQGEFWNAPFGAARPLRELGGAGGLMDFLARGRRMTGDDA
ncbi:hypothetical protein [Streptomyces sp. CBMA123]|uniref:hypothetical protein n=1 Tax=Streptomyces sp. CBMA123 TaxID=1896313 RepID=UPI0016618B11|nr:hypothetical protein [Streptomyces sp. CBMA123]MBD0692331.1 hypothetical protein [Streptomyces sp. CBMA123]